VFGSNTYVPGWEHATGWSRRGVFLTPEEAQDLMRQMRNLLTPYEPRKSDPSLRPAGALPVEWTIFDAPVAELVETVQAQAQEAAEAQVRDVAKARGRAVAESPSDPGPKS
jgi:hypothetical protein